MRRRVVVGGARTFGVVGAHLSTLSAPVSSLFHPLTPLSPTLSVPRPFSLRFSSSRLASYRPSCVNTHRRKKHDGRGGASETERLAGKDGSRRGGWASGVAREAKQRAQKLANEHTRAGRKRESLVPVHVHASRHSYTRTGPRTRRRAQILILAGIRRSCATRMYRAASKLRNFAQIAAGKEAGPD